MLACWHEELEVVLQTKNLLVACWYVRVRYSAHHSINSFNVNIETTLPSRKEARIFPFIDDVSLASFQWCFLRIAHNYP